MPDYDLGTARGRIDIDGDGAERGFTKATKGATNFTKASKIAGGVIAGAGVAIAAGLGLAINSAANFEQRMSAVEAVSGASGKQLEALRETALRLGADTKFSATEAASAIEELVKAGIPVEDVLNGAADAAVNLAAAGEIELAEAATIAANALNVFNLEGKDMEHVADLIAGAANASAIDVSQFGLSLQQAGATASLVGLSFDDLTLAIAAMGDAGIKGSDAGTSLKTFLANLQPVTKKQIDLFKELGLVTEDGGNKFFDAQGKIKPMREIAETLQTALAGLTDQQKTLALETLFGSDAIRAAAIIAGEGAEGFDELAASVGKTSAAEVAAKRMDNLKGSLEQLKGSLETLLIQIGTPLLKGIRGAVDFLTKLVNKFGELSPGMQKAIGIAAAVTAAFLIIGGTVLLLVGWLGTVAAAVGLTVGALLGVIAVAFAVVAVIGALIAAIVLLWKENETFRETVKKVWNFIKDTVLGIIETVTEGIHGLIEAFKGEGITSDGFVGVMERIGVAARAVVDFITDELIPAIQHFADEVVERWGSMVDWLEANVFPVFTAIGELIQGVIRVVIGALNVMEPIFRGIWQAVVIIVTTAVENIRTVIETVIGIIIILWNNFGQTLFNIMKSIWDLIRGVVEGALQIIRGIIQVVTGLITLNWSQVWEGIKNIVLGVWNVIKAIVTAGIEGIKNVIALAIGVIKTLWQAGWLVIQNVLKIAWNTIKAVVQLAINQVKSIIQSALNLIKNIWNAAWGVVRNFVTTTWSSIKSIVSSGISAVVGFLRELPGKALSAASSLKDKLATLAKNAMSSMANAISSGITRLIELAKSIPDRIMNAIGNLGSLLLSAGRNLINGFIDGIKSGIGKVKDTLVGIKDKLTSWKGPPRVDAVILTPVGELVLEGFIKGIQNQVKPLKKTLASIMPDVQGDLGSRLASRTGHFGTPPPTAPVLNFNFPNVRTASDAKEVEATLSNSEVLAKIIHATRAGAGAR